jgi:hypothetical protein
VATFHQQAAARNLRRQTAGTPKTEDMRNPISAEHSRIAGYERGAALYGDQVGRLAHATQAFLGISTAGPGGLDGSTERRLMSKVAPGATNA